MWENHRLHGYLVEMGPVPVWGAAQQATLCSKGVHVTLLAATPGSDRGGGGDTRDGVAVGYVQNQKAGSDVTVFGQPPDSNTNVT